MPRYSALPITSLVLTVAVVVLAGCASTTTPPAPGPRVLDDARVRAFTDHVLDERITSLDPNVKLFAGNPDVPGGGLYGGVKPYRSQIEEQGRAVCSHLIVGETTREAFDAVFPYVVYDDKDWQLVKIAAHVLCPTT